jgi:RNA polymerase sigma factor (TIGR02999 family)
MHQDLSSVRPAGHSGDIENTLEDLPDNSRDALLADLYHDLRAAAARLLRREAPTITMQPTDLVNEASLKLLQMDTMVWTDRQHFFATGARLLRQAMIDAIRRRKRQKRKPPETILDFVAPSRDVDVETLDHALAKLERTAPDMAQLIELRYFVGLSIDEVAAVCEVSSATISRRWQVARAWLVSEMQG